MKNKYVDFVSDEHFEKCVNWVIHGYAQKRDIRKNGVDAFKTIFDMIKTELNFEQWKNIELTRQKDKNISNKIGEFHQKLLGGVEGWCDLKTGDVADLSNDSKTIFLELKNKHNTVKGADMIELWKRLDKITKKYPKSIVYWAYINAKDGSSGEDIWIYQNKSNPKVKKIWGKNIYELITGKKNALTETLYALPKAISNVTDNSKTLDIQNDENLTKWLNDSF
tara:strand:- start:68 stop:736 length:669 start_codon:yes stop_codon:yes gene_type:complete